MTISNRVANGAKDSLRRSFGAISSPRLVHLHLGPQGSSDFNQEIGPELRALSLKVVWLNHLGHTLTMALMESITWGDANLGVIYATDVVYSAILLKNILWIRVHLGAINPRLLLLQSQQLKQILLV